MYMVEFREFIILTSLMVMHEFPLDNFSSSLIMDIMNSGSHLHLTTEQNNMSSFHVPLETVCSLQTYLITG